MRIEHAAASDVAAVALNMRHRDYLEFSAVSPCNSRSELADLLTARFGDRPGDVLAVFDGERPVAIGGLIESRPNVITLLFFATDNFPAVALPLTRFIKRELFPRYIAAGVHRFEAVSMHRHEEAHRWLKILGLKMEAALFGYGRDRETFVQFAWTDDACPAGA